MKGGGKLGVRDEIVKDRCMKIYKEEKRKVNKNFESKINQVVDGNRKLFWKEGEWWKGGELW